MGTRRHPHANVSPRFHEGEWKDFSACCAEMFRHHAWQYEHDSRMSKTIVGQDGKSRCRWCAVAPDFLPYHDTEWGFPVSDDHRLFEKLSLEAFQSGLSWRTILTKRMNFRVAFHDFDFDRIARFTQRDLNRLLEDEGIVRHRGKIEAVINNARQARELVKREGSLAAFIWRYEPDPKQLAEPQTASTSAESLALSKDLKKLGWKFVGPTTAYAFMQAMGLINDHAADCVIRSKVERARKSFRRPE
jgi:DNA-3-methyladenine glycosylase I